MHYPAIHIRPLVWKKKRENEIHPLYIASTIESEPWSINGIVFKNFENKSPTTSKYLSHLSVVGKCQC